MRVRNYFLMICMGAIVLAIPISGQAGVVQDQQVQIDDLRDRIEYLEELLENVTRSGDEIYFDAVNVNIRNGLGATNGDPLEITNHVVNGLGNLIVGYNEENFTVSDKSGSHNLVVGPYHNYSSHGGMVAGYGNTVSGINSTVCGGNGNEANGVRSTVCGGGGNVASGIDSTISGGRINIASGNYASVSGGDQNEATGLRASVNGGRDNSATGADASVSGGYHNTASGQGSSVSGGQYNEAKGYISSVSGGEENTANGYLSSVSGGELREATSNHDWVAGSAFEDN